ncbi:TraB/GumN family protein [Sphingomonas canadensis]|uniref:TraB/GumN family protein n=1 Tax=Sphingomonas canadensis TaxID=1219257 RepID=A0ABW3H317_9SPHN|nr:TraB/GumN family protein [Sphingomonas canadensis]MCW3835375.1 TraB/GumN family protein [Sphingomonas canadensis]
MLNFLSRAFAALALLLAPAAHAQVARPADPALWVVQDEDTTIYLFGTVHVLRPGLQWFDSAVWAAFNQSDELVMELADPSGPETVATIMKLGMTTTGPTLSEKLTEEQRAIYLPALKGMGLPPALLDRQKPWMASVTLSMLPLLKAGYDPASGPESILLAAARKGGKTVAGLETVEEQLGFFDKMPEAAQIAGLIDGLKRLDAVTPMTDNMVDAWAKGDPDTLGRLVSEAPGSSPEMVRFLLTDRNANWAKWITQRMAQPGEVFIAVGAGHLAGKQSVQAFLAKRGLKAKRILY